MEANFGSDSKTLSSDAAFKDLELQARVKFREKRFREILSPLEGYILQLQSLLVWEKPRRSALMFIVVNVVFWLASATQYRIVFLAAVFAIIYVCVETIYSKVWPEIRVPPTDPEEEGWTPVHADLLSLPELCEYLGKIWVWLEDSWARFCQVRQRQPAKFCLYLCSTCLILAGIGQQISGIILTYLILMGFLLWPCLEYNQVTKHILQKVRPLFKQFEHSVEQTAYQARKQRESAKLKRGHKAYAAARRELLGESDSELDEFCPTPNPAHDAVFAQAGTMTPAMGSLRATPITMFSVGVMPRGLSIDDDGHTDTEGNSLMAGLSSMPAYDDGLLDHSADELDIELPRDSNNSSMRETPPPRLTSSPPGKIKFVSTHFEESSSDEEFGLPQDVRIPNYDTYDRRGRARHHSNEALSAALPQAAAQLLSNTVATVMQDAIMKTVGQLVQNPDDHETKHTAGRAPSGSGISRENVRRRKPKESKPKEDLEDDIDRPQLAPSDSAELVEQFEVLDQSELDNEPSGSLNQSSSSDGGSISRLSDYGMGLINSWWQSPGKK